MRIRERYYVLFNDKVLGQAVHTTTLVSDSASHPFNRGNTRLSPFKTDIIVILVVIVEHGLWSTKLARESFECKVFRRVGIDL